MIEYPRDTQNTIPTSLVKIVGLGGAGANVLNRVALDGMEGAELLVLNTDVRTLSGSVADERIQLGRNLTKGLGTGGDPELGNQAVMEAEDEIRASLKGRKIVFICVGLGGGTGSGSAPIVARIAREEGAFVVMFATMPFVFEGRRRREQAETGLNELAVLSNALVTFDNGRMGELVLAKQGIHEAFAAADRMISESIKAVIRLVVRPGLINIGLDDLMSALRTTRSRCLFGSGISRGKDRAQKALRNALASPLLDQGALLADADTVLVHLCGGESLTLFEIELLMESLSKHVPAKAHVLFGAAVDPGMGDELSITLVSSLPEERLRQPWPGADDEADDKVKAAAKKSEKKESAEVDAALAPSMGFEAEEETQSEPSEEVIVETEAEAIEPEPEKTKKKVPEKATFVVVESEQLEEELEEEDWEEGSEIAEEKEGFFAEPVVAEEAAVEEPVELKQEKKEQTGDDDAPFAESGFTFKPAGKTLPKYNKSKNPRKEGGSKDQSEPFATELDDFVAPAEKVEKLKESDQDGQGKKAKGKTKSKDGTPQGELSFEGGPRGRFEGADPNVFDGEDLDVPAFLRKKQQ